jgi:2-methylisocitrate lyase-like PEP mutase family enzyme
MGADASIPQADKARYLRVLHHDPRLLILPNVWDALGARLLESLGAPAVATASAAVAWSLGRDDGEVIPFDDMCAAIARVASAVAVPVSADIERGYADSPDDVAANIARVVAAGAVGINIEDSYEEGGELRPVAEQVERLRAARAAGDEAGVPLVINARIDVWLGGVDGGDGERQAETVRRALAYLDAGADCVYPIGLSDIDRLESLRDAIGGAPINVFVGPGAPALRDLEAAGMARASVGPGLLKVALGAIRGAAEELLNYGSYERLADAIMTGNEVGEILSREE